VLDDYWTLVTADQDMDINVTCLSIDVAAAVGSGSATVVVALGMTRGPVLLGQTTLLIEYSWY
jgi:hypothetical protein